MNNLISQKNQGTKGKKIHYVLHARPAPMEGYGGTKVSDMLEEKKTRGFEDLSYIRRERF